MHHILEPTTFKNDRDREKSGKNDGEENEQVRFTEQNKKKMDQVGQGRGFTISE